MDVAISTYGATGLERVAAQQLPKVEGVEYVVSWQEHGDVAVPAVLSEREDVRICRFDGHGQSANRNNSMACCRADLVLIADDDVAYDADALKQLMALYAAHPEMDVCAVKVDRPGDFAWPERMIRFGSRYPKGYAVGAYEISFRRSRIGDLCFHPEFGINAPLIQCGEDSLFLHTAILRGLSCWFAPIQVGVHPHETTGSRQNMSAGVLIGQGALMKLMYPWSFVLRVPLKAWRLWRSGHAGFWKALWCQAKGSVIAIRMLLSRDRSLLW